ncbi:MAG: FAD-binding oxidoreductase [Spirochaetales bacterium]|nr:FAD-binding oxidoreductase [Spirochaetales bacterium]
MEVERKWWGWGAPGEFYDVSNRPNLWSFFRKYGAMEEEVPSVTLEDLKTNIPEPVINRSFLDEITEALKKDAVKTDAYERIMHTYDQNCMDMLLLRKGIIRRAPDAVIYPGSHGDVEKIVGLAHKHDVCVIAFGGGTNVVNGTVPETREKRMIINVDMGRMKKIIKIDNESHIAWIEAGMPGIQLEKELNALGYTSGHDPDSMVYSTVGGWVATRSSGMLSNKYGDFTDLTVSIKMVTPAGTIATPVLPATSAGPDLNRIIAGSEGTFGIITEVVIKIFPLPETAKLNTFLFTTFDQGVKAIQEMVEKECIPALVRLVNEDEVEFALKTARKSKSWFKNKAVDLFFAYLSKIRKIDMDKTCYMILGYKGDKKTVRHRQKITRKICKRNRAIDLGRGAAKTWDEGKYDLILIRDLIVKHGVLTDSAETATVWSNLVSLYNNARKAILDTMQKYAKPAWLGCHISHVYRHGASLYFLFGCKEKKGEEVEQYLDIKNTATAAFVSNGGTVSHHHSVGVLHQPYLKEEIGETAAGLLLAIKKKLDPKNIMNPGKLIPGSGNGDKP